MFRLTPDQIKIFLLLGAVVGFFIWGRLRYDLVAISALLIAVIIGVVPSESAFSGFANSAVITVAAVLIISKGLAVSGVIDRIAHVVVPPVKALWLQIGSMSGFAAILSAFMNNVGALALLMPATIDSAKSTGRSPSLLLMPLSFGSILGGLITLIGTPPNIVIANYRETALGAPYEMFDFTPVGSMIAFGGLLFLALVGWRLLPKDRQAKSAPDELFAIDDYVAEVIVGESSKAVGMTVAELDPIIDNCSIRLAGIIRKGRRNLRPGRRTVIEDKDILVLEAAPKDLDKFAHDLALEVKGDTPKDRAIYASANVELAEVVVSADSRIIGRKVGDLRLRSRYGLNLLGVSRQGKPIRRRLHHVVFRSGDILLVQAETGGFQVSAASLGLLPLAGRGFQIGRRSQAWIAALLLAGAIALAAIGWVKLTIFPVSCGAWHGAFQYRALARRLPLHRLAGNCTGRSDDSRWRGIGNNGRHSTDRGRDFVTGHGLAGRADFDPRLRCYDDAFRHHE